jgi:virulence-associated protein VapD
MVINNKQLYKITLTREQLMLISRCVEDISRYAAGDMDLQHTTETLIDDMDRTESLGIRSFIANNSMAIRRRLFPDLEDYEHIGYDGGSKDMINRKRLIGNTYQIYRSILHQLAIDENWNNVYSDMTTDLDRLILQYQSQEGSLQNQEDSCQFWDLSKNMATGKEH